MFVTHISPYIFTMLLSTFLKCIALLIIAALFQLCLKKLSSNLKHVLWLTMLFSIVIIPACFFIIPLDFFRINVQSRSSFEALRILDAVLPRYNEFGSQMQPAAGVVAVTSTTQSMGLISSWAVIGVALWIAGIMFSLIRVIVGKIGIVRIRTDARFIENKSIIETLKNLTKKLGIQRNIQVLTSSSCRVPFTYRTIKPVILLPFGATAWPSERLRSVLLHELAHVKRLDSLTLLFARIVCSLFWFIPTVWIAYRHLHIEQEKSCDEYAVGEGIKAARYVQHIMNVVRLARGRVLLTGIFITRGKKKMLEKRILHLLKSDALKFLTRKKVLIASIVLCFFVLFPILVFNPIFAEDGAKSISEQEFWDTISGVWINTHHYSGNVPFQEQKVIIHSDGKFGFYPLITDTVPVREINTFIFLTQAWIDSEGFVWFKGTLKDPYTFYLLGRITDSGNTWEWIGDSINNPTEWDTSKVRYEHYEIRYRQ